MNIEEEKLFELIDEEYEKIFNNENIDENIKKNIEQFIADIPFKIYLKEKKSIIDKNNK